MALTPTLTYSNIKHKVADGVNNGVFSYKNEDITVVFNGGAGGNKTYKVSYNAPFNEITGSYISNRSLSRFEVRVNPIEATDWGPGIGNLAGTAQIGIAANTSTNFTIPVTASVFTGSQSNTYRVCLLAQSSVDHSWDYRQLFMVIGPGDPYKPINTDGYSVWGSDEIAD